MDGTWLMVHEQSICVETLGLNAEALSVSAEIVEMTQNGGRVTEDRTICSIGLTKLLDIATDFPNVAAQAHQPIFMSDSSVSGNSFGAAYASGLEAQLFGLTMEDPLTETMPENADDPRVVDADNDGQPGVTLLVSGGAAVGGCDMYVLQRSAIRYLGQFERSNLINGTSITYYSQKVLGASQSLCAVPRTITPNDRSSVFVMHRVDGQGGSLDIDYDGDGTISCDEANEATRQLWQFREPNNELCGGTN
jgi:hypothetical protein